MICPKIARVIAVDDHREEQQQIVTGITDYIPQCLKAIQNINISIVGNQHQIINQILWNEFFAKTLIKQSYYFLMQNYSTEGRQTMTAVFLKFSGKVFKVQEIMDWNSTLQIELAKSNEEVVKIEIQGFSNKGNIKKITIFISKYPINIQKLHLILKTGSIQVPKLSKNDNFSLAAASQYRVFQQTDRLNKQSQQGFSTNKTKFSQISSLSIGTKKSHVSKYTDKQNVKREKATSSKVSSKKMTRQTPKQKYVQSIKTNSQVNKNLSSKSFQDLKPSLSALKYERPSINRQSVLSKIITAKEEQIILLKEQLEEKSDEYFVLIRDQQEAHEKEVGQLTHKVKQILQSYSASQKESANQNIYLKERVKVLEETISKGNDKLQTYEIEIQDSIKKIRDLQEANKKLLQVNKILSNQQQKNRNLLINQSNKMRQQIISWKQKAQDYMIKYQKIVDVMKNVINFT